jgi:hypothetical protein
LFHLAERWRLTLAEVPVQVEHSAHDGTCPPRRARHAGQPRAHPPARPPGCLPGRCRPSESGEPCLMDPGSVRTDG